MRLTPSKMDDEEARRFTLGQHGEDAHLRFAAPLLRLQSVCILDRIRPTSFARERSRSLPACGFVFVAGTGFEPVTSGL